MHNFQKKYKYAQLTTMKEIKKELIKEIKIY